MNRVGSKSVGFGHGVETMLPIPILRKIKNLLEFMMAIMKKQPVINKDMVDFERCGDSGCPLSKCCCSNQHREGVPLRYTSSWFETINRYGPTDGGISIDISNGIHPSGYCRDRELDRVQSSACSKVIASKKFSVSIAIPCRFLILLRSCLHVSSACRDARSHACIPCLPAMPPTERQFTLCCDSLLRERRVLEKSLSATGAMQKGRRSWTLS